MDRNRALDLLQRMPAEERSELVEQVARQSAISVEELETLLSAGESSEFLSPGGPLAGALGARLVAAVEDAERAKDLVGQRVGSVSIERVVGGGGFGRVYLGRDDRLDRPVAVKALRTTQSFRREARERLRREARLLSKLDHPNICRIYGLAEEAGGDYLLLEYIDGERLTEAARDADFSTKLELSRQIATALAAAHGEDIIHRDLKPDNILVTSDGVVKVLDLGVARIEGDLGTRAGHTEAEIPLDGGADLTRLGTRLGTIRYMSPEQARGEAVTTASDVYALGLLMHELFGSEPAYTTADGPHLLERVQSGETSAFAHPDGDLATLSADLLRKNPADRPTAAETVERIEAILDRPRRQRARLLRRLVAAAVLVTAAAVAIGWWSLRSQAAHDITVAEELLAEVKDIEWRMRAEHLSPAHDITPAREEVKEQVEALASRIQALGKRATGRGHYALGRAAFSIDDVERAREEVAAAWESGYQTPEVAYTLGRILARRYRDQVEANARRYEPEEQETRLVRLREELAEPAARFLRQARGAQVGSPEYIDALLAVGEEDYEGALEELSNIDRAWYYERDLLAGWIHLKRFRNETDRGSIEAMNDHLARAETAYERSVAVGRSDPRGYVELCRTAWNWIHRGLYSGDDARARGEESIAACRRALEIDPASIEARWQLVTTYYYLAQSAFDRGEDARGFLEQAEQVADEGLAVAPDSRDLERSLIKILWRKAVDQQLRGIDPMATYEKGSRIAEKIGSAGDATTGDLQSQVLLAIDHAVHQLNSGVSPVPVLERAIVAGRRSIAIEPNASGWNNLGICFYLLGGYQIDHGVDPMPAVREGLAATQAALEALPDRLPSMRTLGNLHKLAHDHAGRSGGDPEAPYRAARAAYRRAAEVAPKFVWVRIEWLDLEYAHAKLLGTLGRSPEEPLAAARARLSELGRSEATAVYRYLYLGRIELVEGKWQAQQGSPPERAFGRAEAALRRAIEANRLNHNAFLSLAEVQYERALWRRKAQRSGVAAAVEKGQEAIDGALTVKPDSGQAYERRAAFLRLESGLARSVDDREAIAAEAVRAQARACEINPLLPSCSVGG